MKITNFEPKFVFRSLLLFFFVYGSREIKIWLDYKIKGSTTMTSTDYEDRIAQNPSLKTVIKSISWILNNIGYLRDKHNYVNKNRILSTASLQKIKIISNEKQ